MKEKKIQDINKENEKVLNSILKSKVNKLARRKSKQIKKATIEELEKTIEWINDYYFNEELINRLNYTIKKVNELEIKY